MSRSQKTSCSSTITGWNSSQSVRLAVVSRSLILSLALQNVRGNLAQSQRFHYMVTLHRLQVHTLLVKYFNNAAPVDPNGIYQFANVDKKDEINSFNEGKGKGQKSKDLKKERGLFAGAANQLISRRQRSKIKGPQKGKGSLCWCRQSAHQQGWDSLSKDLLRINTKTQGKRTTSRSFLRINPSIRYNQINSEWFSRSTTSCSTTTSNQSSKSTSSWPDEWFLWSQTQRLSLYTAIRLRCGSQENLLIIPVSYRSKSTSTSSGGLGNSHRHRSGHFNWTFFTCSTCAIHSTLMSACQCQWWRDPSRRSEEDYVHHSQDRHEHAVNPIIGLDALHQNTVQFHFFQSGKAYLQQCDQRAVLHHFRSHYYSSGLVFPGFLKGSLLEWEDTEYTVFDSQSTNQIVAETDFEVNSESRLS